MLAANAPRALAMPAAGLAAESGAPILFVTPTRVPRATAAVLAGLHRPVDLRDRPRRGRRPHARTSCALRPRDARSQPTRRPAPPPARSRRRASGEAVQNAIAVARFTDGTFGWGVKEPGHGLVFANAARPLDAPAAALLSATGDYGPLLLLESATQVPPQLAALPVATSSPPTPARSSRPCAASTITAG